ncbi:MAG: hypothetical protein ACOCZU_07330 [Planctomycetota bacterium]
MIRLAAIMFALGAVAVALVHIRREETMAAHEIQRLQRERVVIRRELADRMVRVGELTTPSAVVERSRRLALDLPIVGDTIQFAGRADE